MIGMTILGLLFGVYQYLNNSDKQRQLDDKQKQIDRLQAEFQATQIQRQTAEAQQQAAQAQQHAAEQREREQTRRAEEYAHRARVEVCKAGLRSAQTASKTPGADGFMAMVEKLETSNCLREAVGRLRKIDVSQFGDDKAE